MEAQQHGDQLKRGLKNRHIQLIALGGAIGTGLFLGSASVIQSAGPGIILGYAIAGFIAFLIMRQLGEMVVDGGGAMDDLFRPLAGHRPAAGAPFMPPLPPGNRQAGRTASLRLAPAATALATHRL